MTDTKLDSVSAMMDQVTLLHETSLYSNAQILYNYGWFYEQYDFCGLLRKYDIDRGCQAHNII